MRKIRLLSFLIFWGGASIVHSKGLTFGPFSNIDLSAFSESEKRIIVESSEDFQAVLDGKKPLHSKMDENLPLPADGGTTYYIGNGYRLTIVKSLSMFGSLNGFIYGPILTFDKEFAPGNSSTVSNSKFYTVESLNKLLNRK